MSAKEINRYLELVERRLFILAHSGIDWKPEYAAELEAIDRELAGLRELVDREHERRCPWTLSGQSRIFRTTTT